LNRSLIIGVVLAAVLAVAIGAVASLSGGGGSSQPVATVAGFIGGEKEGLLSDPQVVKILADRYHLRVDFRTKGSIDMVREDVPGKDFLWPSNETALEIYRQSRPSGIRAADTIVNSPIVFYAWHVVTDAMVKEGLFKKSGQDYYVADLAGVLKYIKDGKTWKDIGLPQIFGPIAVVSTDPARSNSGNMFSGLLANMFAGGRVVDPSGIDTVLPQLKAYFDSLGFLETGSDKLFQRFLTTGLGEKPLIAGYESQLIEFSLAQTAENRSLVLQRIRTIYPQPTVYSAHPLIALTAKGELLLDAMKDPQIQKIAWEKHGFRSGLPGINNDERIFSSLGIPPTIESVIPLPRAAVMDRIIQYLAQ
jgi:hypothetical protein